MAAGARLKRLRLARGLTQRELANLAGASQSAVAQLETGRRGWRTSQALIARLARALGLSEPDQLAYGSASEISDFLSSGDEDAAIAAAHEAFCDMAEARLETQTDALLSALDPSRLTAAVILAALLASEWRKRESSWRGFRDRSRAVLSARHGASVADGILDGVP